MDPRSDCHRSTTTTISARPTTVPAIVWDHVNRKLELAQLQVEKKKKKKKKETTTLRKTTSGRRGRCLPDDEGVWIRKLRYGVGINEWIGSGCDAVRQNSLFFDHVLRRNDDEDVGLGRAYIVVDCCDYESDHYDYSNETRMGTNTNPNNTNSNGSLDRNRTGTATGTAHTQARRNYTYSNDHRRERLLRHGFCSPDGKEQYHILGCSNSQVRNHSFLFRRCSRSGPGVNSNEAFLRTILPQIDRLEAKKGVAKRVKYAGLLFSGLQTVWDLPDGTNVREISSMCQHRYDFTDGPGLISWALAVELVRDRVWLFSKGRKARRRTTKKTNDDDQYDDIVPSVLQIRYGGRVTLLSHNNNNNVGGKTKTRTVLCKGVVLVDPTERQRKILSVRQSMMKIDLDDNVWNGNGSDQQRTLGVVDYSRPYQIGKLHGQLACLLSANIEGNELYKIQARHLNAIKDSWTDPASMAYLAAMEGGPDTNTWSTFCDLVQRLSQQPLSSSGDEDEAEVTCKRPPRLPTDYLNLCQKRRKYCDREKLRLHLGCSRLLFGAAFPEQFHDLLEEGQCLVFTENGLLPQSPTDVIVSRSPSYSTGDVRILRAISLPEPQPQTARQDLQRLRNCILFSTRGHRPEPDKMSGGDLDGDQFLVIWDPRFLQYKNLLEKEEASTYDEAPTDTGKDEKGNVDDYISYMARFDNSMLGAVDAAFFATVKEKSLRSEEARTLNDLFSKLVDRVPSALNRFEAIVGSIRSNHRDNGNDHDETDLACWEVLMSRQRRFDSSLLTNYRPTPHDFVRFRFQCQQPKSTMERMLVFRRDHFDGLSVDIEALCAELSWSSTTTNSTTSTLTTSNDTAQEVALTTSTKEAGLLFQRSFKMWKEWSRDVFVNALVEWDKVRVEILNGLDMEENRRRRGLEHYDQLRKTQQKQNLKRNVDEEEAHFLNGDLQRKLRYDLDLVKEKLKNLRAQLGDASRYMTECQRLREEQHQSRKALSAQLMAVDLERDQTKRMESVLREFIHDLSSRCYFTVDMLTESSYHKFTEMVVDLWEYAGGKDDKKNTKTKTKSNTDDDNDVDNKEDEVLQLHSIIPKDVLHKPNVNKTQGTRKNRRSNGQGRRSSRNENRLQLRAFFVWVTKARTVVGDLRRRKEQLVNRELEGLQSQLNKVKVQYSDLKSQISQRTEHQRTLRRKMEAEIARAQVGFGATGLFGIFLSSFSFVSNDTTNDEYGLDGETTQQKLDHCEVILAQLKREEQQCQRLKDQLSRNIFSVTKRNKKFLDLTKCFLDQTSRCVFGELVLPSPGIALPTSLFRAMMKQVLSDDQKDTKGYQKVRDFLEQTLKSGGNPNDDDVTVFSRFGGAVTWMDAHWKNHLATLEEQRKRLQLQAMVASEALANRTTEVSNAKVRRNNLQAECLAVQESELEPLKNRIKEMFCPERLADLEQRLRENTGHEDSICAGQEHLNIVLQDAKRHFWADQQQTTTTTMTPKSPSVPTTKQILETLSRTIWDRCIVEHNRVSGFPSDSLSPKMSLSFSSAVAGIQRGERLPVYDKRAEIRKALQDSDVVVIVAGTGCGKSTQIPQYIADDFHAIRRSSIRKSTAVSPNEDCQPRYHNEVRICCTQPRRAAAKGVATRVAQEYRTELGRLIGYRVGARGSSAGTVSHKVSKDTMIEFVTEGWLLHYISKSPNNVNQYDVIMIDEAHERNVETDKLLARLRAILRDNSDYKKGGDSSGRDQQSVRRRPPPPKVVVMSATIDPARFCAYFDGCPSIDCPGRAFPVEEFYRPPPQTMVSKMDDGSLVDHAVNVLFQDVVGSEEGDCLIFLVGSHTIEKCVAAIHNRWKTSMMQKEIVVAYPLYSSMDEADKDAATDPNHRTGLASHNLSSILRQKGGLGSGLSSSWVRKVVVCTNIAETSLTIKGVKFVIDGGYAKKLYYDHSLGCQALTESRISKASAKQRRGRAGRTEPGKCYYLYSENDYNKMDDYEKPQIFQEPVDSMILYSLKVNGTSIEGLGLLDCPEESEIVAAKERLLDLGMIHHLCDNDKKKDAQKGTDIALTKDGEISARLFNCLRPEAMRMVLSSRSPKLNCFHIAVKLGVILSYQHEDDICFRSNFTPQKTGQLTTTNKEEEKEDLSEFFHDLGDHFHVLQLLLEFELLGASHATERKMKRWCEDKNIRFCAMRQIQSSIENCYKDMKRLGLLANVLEDADPKTLTSSEEDRLLRVYISGFFSHIAECIDPTCISEVGFVHLSRRNLQTINAGEEKDEVAQKNSTLIKLRLGRESCLNHIIKFEDDEMDCIPDDEEEEEKKEEKQSDHSSDVLNKVTLTFIIHGTLMKRSCWNFIKNATILSNGRLIQQYAPQRWLDRVQFDPLKSSTSKRTIKFIGKKILNTIRKTFPGPNASDEVHIFFKWEKCSLALYGNYEKVDDAWKIISDHIAKQKEQMKKSDGVKHYLNKTKIAYMQDGNYDFGCSLDLIKVNPLNKKNNVTPQTWFNATSQNTKRTNNKKKRKTEHKCWSKRLKDGNKVEIFMEGGITNIFKHILGQMFPANMCTFKTEREKIIVSFHEQSRHTSYNSFPPLSSKLVHPLIVSFLKSKEKMQLFLACIDAQEKNFAPENVSEAAVSKNITCAKAWSKLWKEIGNSWCQRNPFWSHFCQRMSNSFCLNDCTGMVVYKPSHNHFEIHASLCNSLRGRVKVAVVKELVHMCQAKFVATHLFSKGLSRSKVWHILARVKEMEYYFTSVLFTVHATYFSDTNEENRNTGVICGFVKDETAFEIYNARTGEGDMLLSLAIEMRSTNKTEMLAAREIVKKEFSSLKDDLEPETNECNKDETKTVSKLKASICCMCRRPTEDDHRKHQWGCDIKGTYKGNNGRRCNGQRLTLCGCLFCRSCFVNAASATLKKERSLQCFRCETPVLSKDCKHIVNPFWKSDGTNSKSLVKLSEHFKEDWDRLVSIAAAMFCSRLVDLDPSLRFVLCPDCNTPTIFNGKHNSHVQCRNWKCRNIFCALCGFVLLPQHLNCSKCIICSK